MTRLAVDKNYDPVPLRTHDLGPITEDGERYLVEVWNLEVKTTDGCRWVHESAFWSEARAIEFGATVVRFGSIHPDNWHLIYDPNAPVELPDYVTDWANPIFN